MRRIFLLLFMSTFQRLRSIEVHNVFTILSQCLAGALSGVQMTTRELLGDVRCASGRMLGDFWVKVKRPSLRIINVPPSFSRCS